MKCLVLGARPYDFEDESGEKIEGATIYYLALDGGDGRGSKGELPLQISASRETFHQLHQLPAYCDLDFRQRPGRGGKPQLTVAGATVVEPVRFGDADDGPPA